MTVVAVASSSDSYLQPQSLSHRRSVDIVGAAGVVRRLDHRNTTQSSIARSLQGNIDGQYRINVLASRGPHYATHGMLDHTFSRGDAWCLPRSSSSSLIRAGNMGNPAAS